MKALSVTIFFFISSIAHANTVEIKNLSCRAFNLLGTSQFSLDEKTNFMTTQTVSTLGVTKNSYLLVSVDDENTIGTTNIPFSKITFHNVSGGSTTSYAMIFNASLREGKSTYTGSWGQVTFFSPFGGPVGYLPLAQINCDIEVVEEAH